MKEWTTPRITALDLSQTAYELITGTTPDGRYLDHTDCEYKDAYAS